MNCNECMHYKMCRFNEIMKPDECAWYERREDFVKLPCRIGDTVYAVLDEDMVDPGENRVCEEPGGVKGLCWDGETWSLMLDGGTIPIGSQFAMLTREEAEEYLNMLIQKEKEDANND